MYVSVLERGLGEALGVDGGWLWMGVGCPLPTRPQRHCDPASLVLSLNSLIHSFFLPLTPKIKSNSFPVYRQVIGRVYTIVFTADKVGPTVLTFNVYSTGYPSLDLLFF